MSEDVLNAVRRELAWLRESGIQVAEGLDAGGVYGWLDESAGAARPGPFLYSEITGYFMTLCTHLAELDARGRGDWLERGSRAADWIVRRAMRPDGAVLSRKYGDPARAEADPYSFERGRVALFDCAMVGFGLVRMHAATGETRWRDAASSIRTYLERAMLGPGGEPRCALVEPGGPVPPDDRWSGHVGPFLLKGAMFLDALGADVGGFVSMALSRQDRSGRFPTSERATHLHPHSYTIEGLLHLASRQEHRRAELLDAAQRALSWTFETCLLRDDPVQQWSEAPGKTIADLRSDALAQSLRAFEMLKRMRPGLRFPWEASEASEPRVAALYERLASFSLPSGGTAYGRDEYGEKRAHANAWCHFFALEARLWRAGAVLTSIT